MTNKPTPSTTTKHLATQTGVVKVPRRDDVANDFLRARRASPPQSALDLFPEETAPAAGAGVAVAPPTPRAAAPAPFEARAFAWPPDDEEWTPPVHVSPVGPQAQSASHWTRELVPIAAIVAIFLMIVLSLVVWVARDISTTRASRRMVESEPPPTIPPLKPRPLTWAQAAALADQAASPASASATVDSPTPPASAEGKTPTPAPLDRPAVEATPDRPPVAADRPAPAAGEPPAGVQPAARSEVAAKRTAVRPAPPDRPRPSRASAVGTRPAAPTVSAAPTPLTAPSLTPSAVSGPPTELDLVPVPVVANDTRPSPTIMPVRVTAAEPSSAARTPLSRDEDDIRRVLGRYRAAYSDLDPYAARAVWPTVDMKALTRAFDQLSSQTLEFNQCRVSVVASEAVVTCDGETRYVPKVGSRTPRTEDRRLRFDLHKANEGWTIDSVSSR